jgi:hypothetical protein
MKSETISGEIKTNNPLPYQFHVSINAKPVLTGFGVTLSKNYYMWVTTTTSVVNLKFTELDVTR